MPNTKKVHNDAFTVDVVLPCYIVRIRRSGRASVIYNLRTGAIVPLNKVDIPLFRQWVGQKICLNRTKDEAAPVDIYQEGIFHKVANEDVFFVSPFKKERNNVEPS